MTELIKRLYIGGLAENCTEKDLIGRFEQFGKILTVDIPQNNITGKPKGFGYISLKISEQSYRNCLSALSKTKWRGKELIIEEAKIDYMQRLRNEWEIEAEKKEEIKLSKTKKKRNEYIRAVDDLTPVNDETAKDKKGWVIGKYGRAMSILRIKNPRTKQMFKYDPTKYQNSLIKFNIPYLNIPLEKLTLNIDKTSSKDKKSKTTPITNNDNNINVTNKTNTSEVGIVNKKTEKLSKEEIEKKKELANQRRLESLKEKQERNKLAKQQIKQALIDIDSREKKDTHIKFDDDDEVIEENDNNNNETKSNKQSGGGLTLFDSDDDEDDENEDNLEKAFEVKKVFEGKSGEERFKLQKSFNGDTRFKLGDEFIDEDEDENDDDNEYNMEISNNKEMIQDKKLNEEDIDKELEEEHERTLDVLNMIFGDNNNNNSLNKENNQAEPSLEAKNEKDTTIKSKTLTLNKPNQLVWNDTARYDPDNEESENLIVNNEKESKNKEDSLDNDDDTEITHKVETTTQAPVVSKEKHFEVSNSLTSILLGESKNKETGFSLFGFRNEEENNENDNNNSFMFGFSNSKENDNNEETSFSFSFNKATKEDEEEEIEDENKDITKNLSSTKLFFFHLGEKDLSHRSLYSDANRVFMRTETIPEITAAFENQRQELTQEFKRKHKSAARKKIKMQRLNNNKKKSIRV